jgi:hypothetical protein
MAETNIRTSVLRRRRARLARLDFAAIEIVGALLTPDIVAKVAALEAGQQTKESYGIPLGLALRDEIARYYRIAEALWARFQASRNQHPGASALFVTDLLRQCFGFDTLAEQPWLHAGERDYPVGHVALGGRVPIVIAPATAEASRKSGLDESLSAFGDGTRRRSATLLAQEFLNASPAATWGIVCDGATLRILRDNVSMTRPAWVEANLAKIFTEGLFPDFSALWLLAHQSRFGAGSQSPSECALEHWRDRGKNEGVAARKNLQLGVKEALLELGQGFIENPKNEALRQALSSGDLSGHAYYEELLRLVYRMIFLFVAEDRGLLHAPEATEESRKLYADGYSLGRLRERCIRRTAWDRHEDGWEGAKAAQRALGRGEARLGLTALGGLFAPGVLPHLDACRLENRRLLAAVWRLSWLRPEGQALTRVNWRDMEAEELGSVYENLLEQIPRASADTRTFDFAPTEEGRGNARKSTGSYYTPEALVKLLLDSTLDPVLDAAEARNPADPPAEILKLTILDPACGSGHFLLGAARRAAARVAKWRSPGAPSQAEFQHALREVVSHCIYGVDRNPMAVELCRVALWIESLEAGKPLSFLASHIRTGDSLLGVFDLAMLRSGIPDAAYAPLTGDAKDVAKAYERLNKEGRDEHEGSLYAEFRPPEELIRGASGVFTMPEDTLEQVAVKQAAYNELHGADSWRRFQLACDCYIGAFLLPKTFPAPDPEDLTGSRIPLTEHVWDAIRGASIPEFVAQAAGDAARRVTAFHWLLQFPDIFSRGGFDVVIGNPPWEVSQLSEQEYFAAEAPEIAALPGEARKKAIDRLADTRPQLWAQFQFDKRAYDAANTFFRASGRFDLTAVGKVNSYALFAEHFLRLVGPSGRAGVIVPTGIATDSSTSAFFGSLVSRKRIAGLTDFENREGLFAEVDSRMKFCALIMGAAEQAQFAFFLTQVSQLEEPERRFTLSAEEIARMNPNTKTAPVFRSRADAELTAKLYRKAPVLIEERPDHPDGDLNPWGITFQQGLFNMTSASELFRTQRQLEEEGWQRSGVNWENDGEVRVPLYEAKMIHQFDHRSKTYDGGASGDEEGARECTWQEKQDPCFEPTPRYWVPESEVVLRAARVPATLKRAYRDDDAMRCLKALAEWVVGYFLAVEGRTPREQELFRVLGADQPWRTALGGVPDRFLRSPKTVDSGKEIQRATPLNAEDLLFLQDGPEDAVALVKSMIDRKQPRWLMGWRDICRSTDERTVIASVFPLLGTGDTLLLMHPVVDSHPLAAALIACLCSLTLDYVCRQKIGGTHLKYNVFKQNAVLPPSAFSPADTSFVTQRVLELTYTSRALKPWAEDMGYSGAPFSWDWERRAQLRAELDAFFARKYGLFRDELRYILDPGDIKGTNYPSETFRVLKNNEESCFGEFRTQRLVLEAWDRLENV